MESPRVKDMGSTPESRAQSREPGAPSPASGCRGGTAGCASRGAWVPNRLSAMGYFFLVPTSNMWYWLWKELDVSKKVHVACVNEPQTS